MKNLIVAKTAGFCMGVKRAVDMTLELINKSEGPVYTYGPLIHNPQIIELLAKKGVVVLEKTDTPKEGTIVIRTHGISPSMRKKLESCGINISDATCPFVKNVQRIIEEYSKKGYTILIVGDKGHAEVDSYMGYADNKGIVISSVDELDKQDIQGKVCVVSQTTQDKRRFNEIIDRLRNMDIELAIFDTICNATSKRQEEALEISNKVDAMIVVGGKNSANTLRLAEICKSTDTPTYFIERPEELNLGELSRYATIGITAGASTAKETIQEVVDYINKR